MEQWTRHRAISHMQWTEARLNVAPVLQVCTLNICPQHVQLPMVAAHGLPFFLLLLPSGLPLPALLHQPLIGSPLGGAHLLEGRLGETAVGSAYRSLPVHGRLQGMLGNLCCCLVFGLHLFSYLQ